MRRRFRLIRKSRKRIWNQIARVLEEMKLQNSRRESGSREESGSGKDRGSPRLPSAASC